MRADLGEEALPAELGGSAGVADTIGDVSDSHESVLSCVFPDEPYPIDSLKRSGRAVGFPGLPGRKT